MSIEKLNTIFDKFKDKFEGAFHSVLWKLMINHDATDRLKAFTPCLTDQGIIVLGIAHKGLAGYTPSLAYFKPDTHYKDATSICEELNREVFGLTSREANKIVLSSMVANKIVLSSMVANK